MKVISFKTWNPNYINIYNAICINFINNTNTYYILFVKNGKIHNSKYPAEIIFKISKNIYYTKYYYLFDEIYYEIYNNSNWRKYNKKLLQENKLKIFK